MSYLFPSQRGAVIAQALPQGQAVMLAREVIGYTSEGWNALRVEGDMLSAPMTGGNDVVAGDAGVVT